MQVLRSKHNTCIDFDKKNHKTCRKSVQSIKCAHQFALKLLLKHIHMKLLMYSVH